MRKEHTWMDGLTHYDEDGCPPENIVVNDLKLDAIKDNFKPPMMEELGEEVIKEILSRMEISLEEFEKYVYDNSEYWVDKEKKYYLVKDLTFIIKKHYTKND